MAHGGEAARPPTVGSAELGMAGAVRGSEAANIGSGAFDDAQLGAAAAARRFSFDAFFEPGAAAAGYHDSAEFARHVRASAARGEVPPVAAGFHFRHQPGPGVAYASIGEFGPQPGPVGVVLVDPRLPDGVVPVHDPYGYAALQPRPGAGRAVVLDDLLTGGGGAVYNGDYAWQSRPGAGRGEVFLAPLPDGDGAVFDNSGNFGEPTLPGTGRADGIAGALRDPNLGAGYGGSGALADDIGAVYDDDPGMAAQHLPRLLAFVGIGASSVAVNGLAAGPGSPAAAFHLFVLLLAGLFLIILHVLRV